MTPPTFHTATPADIAAIAADIRPSDAEELRIGCWGLPPLTALANSVAISDHTIAAHLDATPVAIFGIRAHSLIDRTAIIWMIGTRTLDTTPRILARASRPCLRSLMATLPWAETFHNAFPTSHTHVRQWLAWLGAWFSTPILVTDPEHPETTIPFTPFTIGRQ